jgi:hypothetical protein
MGLRPLACLHFGFESRRRHGCLPLLIVVCCQVEVSALGWSLFPEEPYRVWCECDREASIMRGPRHTVAVASWGEGSGLYQRGNQLTNISCIFYYVGRRNVFGTVTGYGVDVPGIESPCGRYLPHLSRPVLGLTRPPMQWVPLHTPGVKRPGRVADHPSPI